MSRSRGRRRTGCDRCDACDACDVLPGCDLGLVSGFLLAAAVLVGGGRNGARPLAARGRLTPADRAGIGMILGYQRWISPRLPVCCRYAPSCSHYGLAAVRRYGLAQGLRLAGLRVRRCRSTVMRGTPDPVPGIALISDH